MIKTVYGPPPVDAERIEAAAVEMESDIREAEETTTASSGASKEKRRKGRTDSESGCITGHVGRGT